MKPKVLLLCTANSIRSQMAEGLWRLEAGDTWEVHSAGVAGAGGVHPLVIAALDEVGADSDRLFSKPLSVFQQYTFTTVVALSEEAALSLKDFPESTNKLLWIAPDPTAHQPGIERSTAFRNLREFLWQKIKQELKT